MCFVAMYNIHLYEYGFSSMAVARRIFVYWKFGWCWWLCFIITL